MSSVTQRLQPGAQRLAGALERIAVEAHELLHKRVEGGTDWRARYVLAQQKVLDHYREVLAAPGVPQADRVSIPERIARLEAELADLTAPFGQSSGHRIP